MYADYQARRRFHPVSALAALAINGAVISALIFAVPNAYKIVTHEDPTLIDITPEKTPPPPEQKPKEQPKEQPRETVIYAPTPPITPPVTPPPIGVTEIKPITLPPVGPGVVDGTGDKPVEPVKVAPPPFIGAVTDPRYAKDFQPDYPDSEIRANRDGYVTVRVKIGTDGRVKDVQQVSATSSAFFDATRRHALRNWRFKPATRGGVAEESWKEMKVRFTMVGAN